jgi:uncharacterized membrane protein
VPIDEIETDQVLVGVSFADTFRAQEFLTAMTGLASRHQMRLRDAVIVSKDDDGDVKVRETTDLQTGRTALSSAMWSGLIGLLVGGPVGWIAGMGVGAGAGAVAAKVIDIGVPDEWVDSRRWPALPAPTISTRRRFFPVSRDRRSAT